MVRMKYCGTVGKPDGNREDKSHPKATGASSLLETSRAAPVQCERPPVASRIERGILISGTRESLPWQST